MKQFFVSIFVAPLIMVMAACQTGALGIDNARLDTANKQLLAYSGEVSALAALTEDLFDRRVLDNNTAMRVADALQQANDIIRSATEALARNGDPSQAETDIDRVQALVGIALDLLVDFGLTESTLNQHLGSNSLALARYG